MPVHCQSASKLTLLRYDIPRHRLEHPDRLSLRFLGCQSTAYSSEGLVAMAGNTRCSPGEFLLSLSYNQSPSCPHYDLLLSKAPSCSIFQSFVRYRYLLYVSLLSPVKTVRHNESHVFRLYSAEYLLAHSFLTCINASLEDGNNTYLIHLTLEVLYRTMEILQGFVLPSLQLCHDF